MKKFYLFIISIFIFNFVFAAPVITAVNNGFWDASTTWDMGRVPKDDETIVIPAGRTVTLNKSVTLKKIDLKIAGTLKLDGGSTGLFGLGANPVVLSLDQSSTISILSGGILSGNGTSTFFGPYQTIVIGGNQVYSNFSGQINGIKTINSTGIFGSTPLPVKFVGFTVTLKNNEAFIQWATAQEVNANVYEVERSIDGANWITIAYVAAIGNSSSIHSYAYTDKNISAKSIYYRIKEMDVDGSTAFTSIKSVRAADVMSSADIKIAGIQNKVLIQFPQQLKGNILVRFISMNGQVADQQIISNPVGQVVLNSKLRGNYIIAVSNGQGINTARQVIL